MEKNLTLLQVRILRARLAAQVFAGMYASRRHVVLNEETTKLLMDEAIKAADYFIEKCHVVTGGME